MNVWFKVWIEFFNNPKTIELQSRPKGYMACVIYFNLIGLAKMIDDGGLVYTVKEEELPARKVKAILGGEYTSEDVDHCLAELERVGYVERKENGQIMVRNFGKYQSNARERKKTLERVNRYRERKRREEESGVDEDGRELHGEYVRLRPDEHERLISRYGEAKVNEYIERLNNWIGVDPEKTEERKRKNHNLTIQNWCRRDGVWDRSKSTANGKKCEKGHTYYGDFCRKCAAEAVA